MGKFDYGVPKLKMLDPPRSRLRTPSHVGADGIGKYGFIALVVGNIDLDMTRSSPDAMEIV